MGMDILARLQDPRFYQIAVLTALVAFGIAILNFGIRLEHAIAIVLSAQFVQYAASKYVARVRFDPLSALITSLSLTLLLRTEFIAIAALASALAISSKFLLRIHGKHIFNPANFALVTLMLLSDKAWVSSGQWGSAAIGAFTLACLGFIVLTRARRAETTFAFLAMYALLMVGRALWLEDPLSIPLHQLQNGALLIFAFFMISDPKTSPNTQIGRIFYGALVASVAYVIQYIFYVPNGPILALIVSAPLVPLIDLLLRGRLYQWNQPVNGKNEISKGVL
jgi:Na+-transporting NADH:ubiquinone oxidoreductase subunit NqrB